MDRSGLIPMDKYAEAGIATNSQLGGRPTVRQQLLQRRAAYEVMLEDVNKAIEALDANPGAEDVMNAVGKAL